MPRVSDVLARKGRGLVTLPSTASVLEAARLMNERGVGAVLVVDHGALVGIFTERDYARKVILKGKSSREISLSEVMTENPLTVTPETGIDECMKLMSSKFLRYIPVLDKDVLVGVISIGDVVKFIIDEQRYIIEDLEQYITGHHSEPM